MNEALLNPMYGYYSTAANLNSTIFGQRGDFVTSPEMSQLFGELVGIWALTMWQKMGKPKKFKLVELGPGKGTLMDDILRVASGSSLKKESASAVNQEQQQQQKMNEAVRREFEEFAKCITSVHMVEASPHLRHIQMTKLNKTSQNNNNTPLNSDKIANENNDNDKNYVTMVNSYRNIPVYWHNRLEDVIGEGISLQHTLNKQQKDAQVHKAIQQQVAMQQLNDITQNVATMQHKQKPAANTKQQQQQPQVQEQQKVKLIQPALNQKQSVILPDSAATSASSADFVKKIEQEKFNETLNEHDAEVTLKSAASGEPIIVLAHEFFDALPVYQFEYTKNGWLEILVDVNDDKSSTPTAQPTTTTPSDLVTNTTHFKLVLAPAKTFATTFLKLIKAPQVVGTRVEVCPLAIGIVEQLSEYIAKHNGTALIVDYGHATTKTGLTLQGIAKHKFVDPFSQPGQVDLSAYVDFAALQRGVHKSATSFGPITQADFLFAMGIDARLISLLQNTEDVDEANSLIQAYKTMTQPNEMGTRFKVMSIFSKATPAPTGFENCQPIKE